MNIGLAGALLVASQGSPSLLLVTADELEPLPLTTILVTAEVRSEPARIELTKVDSPEGDILKVGVMLGGDSLGAIDVDLRPYSVVDISSLKIAARPHESHIRLTVKVGEARDCFANHDDRDELIVSFREDETPWLALQSYEGCRSAVIELSEKTQE